MFLKIWCSSKKHLILCNCFHIFEKTPHTPCPFEDSSIICWNTRPSPWRPFCLEKFLRVQVPLVCQDSFRNPGPRKPWIRQDNGSEYCLPLAKRFRAKGYQENYKTVTMAPLGFLNEDVKTAGSTKDRSRAALIRPMLSWQTHHYVQLLPTIFRMLKSKDFVELSEPSNYAHALSSLPKLCCDSENKLLWMPMSLAVLKPWEDLDKRSSCRFQNVALYIDTGRKSFDKFPVKRGPNVEGVQDAACGRSWKWRPN